MVCLRQIARMICSEKSGRAGCEQERILYFHTPQGADMVSYGDDDDDDDDNCKW
jgi:hypothetical protein